MNLVSIIVPLYNKETYIVETIQSVIVQTYFNWELIIVDNGSTDRGFALAKQFKHSRLKCVTSPKKGPSAARNFGLGIANGEWLLFLDADDLIEPDYLANQLKGISNYPDANLIVSSWKEFTDSALSRFELKLPAGLQRANCNVCDFAIAFAPWAVHAALIKRDFLTQDLFWPEDQDAFLGEDITFWFRLILRGEIRYNHTQGALYRTQTPGCRTQKQNARKWYIGINKAIEANLNYLQSEGISISAGQCECLMRSYSELYMLARVQQENEIAKLSLQQAILWLNRLNAFHSRQNWKIGVRKILGLRFFLCVRLFFNKYVTEFL